MEPLLREIGVPVKNLFPAVEKRLSDVPLFNLRANRADGHPGELVTEVYAEEVEKILNGVIPDGL